MTANGSGTALISRAVSASSGVKSNCRTRISAPDAAARAAGTDSSIRAPGTPSQEVMVVLEEAIRKKVIDEVPVYLDGMIYEATAIHTTYPEYLNNDLRDLIFHKGINPFLSPCFVQVESQKQRTEIIEGSPCVILATSGMLNGGPVLEYLKRLGPDERNTLVIVGYQAEGTLGRRIQKGWKELPLSVEGKTQTVKINLEAVKEIVYQLRLRNIGGIIIIDFIDMEKEVNREKVFTALEEALRADKSKTNILKISELGLVEMTRKRVRESIGRMMCEPCPYCEGRGYIKSKTTVCHEIFRELRREMLDIRGTKATVTVHPQVADLLYDEERRPRWKRYPRAFRLVAPGSTSTPSMTSPVNSISLAFTLT